MPRRIPALQLERARAMRCDMPIAEAMLWRSLRNRGIGAKFRRQVPVGPYIADFACLEVKLAVEVDGPSHDDPEQRAHDARRDAWFFARGWRIIRIKNDLVIGGGDIPLDQIRAVLAAVTPSSDPC